jgi:GT2 family glycosyltransferase
VRHDHNKGFAGGVNGGIKVAKGEFIALLNNDARPDKDWLAELVRTIEASPKVGMVTAKILDVRGQAEPLIDSTGDYQTTWGMPFPRGRGEVDHGQYDDQLTIFGVSGGASLYRKTVFDTVGLFDERFFAYYEDVDLSFRAQLAGYQAAFCPTAVVNHFLNSTSGGHRTSFTRYHAIKNPIYLWLKNMPLILLLKYTPLFILTLLLALLSSIKHGFLLVHLKAYGAVLLHLPGILLDRLSIQAGRNVSASYIDGLLYRGMAPEPRKMLQSYLPFMKRDAKN